MPLKQMNYLWVYSFLSVGFMGFLLGLMLLQFLLYQKESRSVKKACAEIQSKISDARSIQKRVVEMRTLIEDTKRQNGELDSIIPSRKFTEVKSRLEEIGQSASLSITDVTEIRTSRESKPIYQYIGLQGLGERAQIYEFLMNLERSEPVILITGLSIVAGSADNHFQLRLECAIPGFN